ncbi:MAG: hypothetical protein AAFY58_09290, partial [Planctomycetota bacterium]
MVEDQRADATPGGPVQEFFNLHIQAKGLKGISMSRGSSEEPNGPLAISNCSVEKHPSRSDVLRWLVRAYNPAGFSMSRCTVRGQFYRDEAGKGHPSLEEHPAYVSTPGSTIVANCLFDTVGGQALQFAQRSNPYQGYDRGDNAPIRAREDHVVRSVGMVDCGMGPRGSAGITYFDPGTPRFPSTILLEDVDFVGDFEGWRSADGTWDDENDEPGDRDSEAALTISSYQLADEVAMFGVQGPCVDELTIRRNVWVRNVSRKAMAEIRTVRRVVIEDS